MDNEIKHDTHGRGTSERGLPDDCDCPCRATAKQDECAKGGCGFCQAASSGCNVVLANYDDFEVRALAAQLRAELQAKIVGKKLSQLSRPLIDAVLAFAPLDGEQWGRMRFRAAYHPTPQGPNQWQEYYTNELRPSSDAASWDPRALEKRASPKPAPEPAQPPLTVSNGRAYRCYLCDKPKLQFRSLKPPVCTECRP